MVNSLITLLLAVSIICSGCNAFPFVSSELKSLGVLFVAKRPKVADASEVWPADVPSWSSELSTVPSEGAEFQPLLVSENGLWEVSVTNDSPLWELVLAKVLPEGRVVPASATLAPRGGCDNLCNDEERYTDCCNFVLKKEGGEKWLLIGTEDRKWTYELQ